MCKKLVSVLVFVILCCMFGFDASAVGDEIKLEFIKADARGKPAESFADGSTYTDDGDYVPGPTYDELKEQGYLLDGVLMGLDYTYLDSDGTRKSGRQACWSGGVVFDDNPGIWSSSWSDLAVMYDDLREGEVRFVLPATTYSWTLYEPGSLPGYDEYSYMFYADAGIIGGAGDEMLAGYSVFGCDYDSDFDTWDMYFGYNIDPWGSPGVWFNEMNPYYPGIETYGGADDYSSDSMFLRTISSSGSVLWNAFNCDDFVKLEFIKANADYRPSPYDDDGNFMWDYHAGTFSDGDLSADYEYLKDLDDVHGDVFLDGCGFRLDYETRWGREESVFCWSGGKDASGALVDGGRDFAHDIIDRGKVVFYVPYDVVSWNLVEFSAPMDYLDLDRERPFFAKYDDVGYWEQMSPDYCGLRGRLIDGEWVVETYFKQWLDDGVYPIFGRVNYSGVSPFSYGIDIVDVYNPYTGNILWNERNDIFRKMPDYIMGGSGSMTLSFMVPFLLEAAYEPWFIIHDKMGDGMFFDGGLTASVDKFVSGWWTNERLYVGDDVDWGLELVENPDDGCSFHIVSQDLYGPYNDGLYTHNKHLALKNYWSGYIAFDTGSDISVSYDVSLSNDADVVDNIAWVEVVADGERYFTTPVKSQMENITLSVHKTDESGNDLDGAGFMLQKLYYGSPSRDDPRWYDVRPLAFHDESHFYVGGLSEGVYRIVEDTVPDGYMVMDPVCFYLDVSESGELSVSYELVEIAWGQYAVPFECDGFYSTDGTKRYYDSPSGGISLFGGERETMFTYFKSCAYDNVAGTVISDNGVELDVVNYETTYPKMPETGGHGVVPVVVFGSVCMLFGICIVMSRKHEK